MSRPINQQAVAQLVALWELGLSDRAIAERMRISENAAIKRRQKLRLAANPIGGGHSLTSARAENEEPWDPPIKGMTKRRCAACSFWFAAWRAVDRCPDCRARNRD